MSAFADAHYLFDTHMLNMVEASAGNGVVRTGNELATGEKGAGADMSVDVVSGVCYANATRVNKAATTNVAVSAADGTNPRKDLVTMQSDGTVVVTAGTPAAADPGGNTGPETFAPVPPDLPANEILLAEIWVAASVGQINDADITDRRCYIPYDWDTDIMDLAGNQTVAGDKSFSGTVLVASDIQHIGDTDTKIVFTDDDIDLQAAGVSQIHVDASGLQLRASTQVVGVLDEDAMGTDSATNLCTQQSIKAYADGKLPLFSASSPGAVADHIVDAWAPTERFTNATSYTKLKEITLGRGGTFYVVFDLKTGNASHTGYGRIYRDGGAVGAEQTTNSTTYVSKGEAIAGWAAGEKLQLYVKSANGATSIRVEDLELRVLSSLHSVDTD